MRRETPTTVNLADYLNLHYLNANTNKGQGQAKVYRYLWEDVREEIIRKVEWKENNLTLAHLLRSRERRSFY
jgi:hypothetical protein